MLRGNATERVATSCIKATAVIFTALEHDIKKLLHVQEFLLKNSKNPKTFISGFFITYFLFELTINAFFKYPCKSRIIFLTASKTLSAYQFFIFSSRSLINFFR